MTRQSALPRETSPAPGTQPEASRPEASHLHEPTAPRLTPAKLLGLQRSAGNAAVVRVLQREGRISTGQLATNLRQAREALPGTPKPGDPIRFRVPTGAAITAMVSAGKIPEAKLKEALGRALARMAKEGVLLTSDPVPDILTRLFPSPNKFDETEFEKVVDVKDRDRIYQSVADAETKVTSTDKPKLSAAMDDAVKVIDDVITDDKGLADVFGSKAELARGVYKLAKSMIAIVKAGIDKLVETDYNRDDEQVNLGGWADFNTKRVHFQRKVVEVTDKNEAMALIIHEACHLANEFVDDRGYYGTPGFEDMQDWEKVANAAHYEELPRRRRSISKYSGKTFTPKGGAGKAAPTFEEKVKRGVSEYLRKAWDKAVDVHDLLREIRKDVEGGKSKSFEAKKTRILEISRLEHLTIHEQATPSTIQPIDIVLSEGVARATRQIRDESEKLTYPTTAAAGKTEQDHVAELVAAATAAYGQLTGSAADDKKLLDWLVKEYRLAL